MIDKDKLNKFVLYALGLRFQYGARGENGLVDCYGLALLFAKEFRLRLIDYTYPENWAKNGGNLFLENYHETCTEIKISQMAPGDFILFKYNGVVDHCGIYIGDGRFIDARKDVNVLSREIHDRAERSHVHKIIRARGF